MKLPQTVGEVMTRDVVAIHPNDGLEHLQSGMERYRFRHLPVVVGGMLVGLVTHTDIMRLLATPLANDHAQRDAWIHSNFKVATVMSKGVRTASEDMPLREAAKVLFEQKLGCLPVVASNQQLVGIITEADFVRLYMDLSAPEAPSVWATDKPAS